MIILVLLFVVGIPLAISLYKMLAVSTVKIAAFAIDFALVFLLTCFYGHSFIGTKLATGNLVYLIDIALGIIATLAYGVLIILLHSRLPKVSMVLNFFIVLIGVSVAYPLALDFISAVLKMLGIVKDTFTELSLFENGLWNKILHYLIIFILALPIFGSRITYLNGNNGSSNEYDDGDSLEKV